MPTTHSFGPAFVGWQSYNDFEASVKTEARFVRSRMSDRFLDEVRASCGTRKQIIPKGRLFWRARLGCECEAVTNQDAELTVGYPVDRHMVAME